MTEKQPICPIDIRKDDHIRFEHDVNSSQHIAKEYVAQYDGDDREYRGSYYLLYRPQPPAKTRFGFYDGDSAMLHTIGTQQTLVFDEDKDGLTMVTESIEGVSIDHERFEKGVIITESQFERLAESVDANRQYFGALAGTENLRVANTAARFVDATRHMNGGCQ